MSPSITDRAYAAGRRQDVHVRIGGHSACIFLTEEKKNMARRARPACVLPGAWLINVLPEVGGRAHDLVGQHDNAPI